ncbi:FG-GAP-like repeat-containing protein [Puniceibacterium sp. IMCC21224]|uniref:FG-GAP-like repeat-containing protein n=1 Tax=Puniceibacterium sp. IMCC21224 TaxID=1618204 RepID=UPI00064D94F7|nr:FG-GAP-like repeat-containing protein [Puniceibacterium sp. IMCC21224]KMK63990.1 putative permease [Puniceibacterium sp. IMCC21224]
MLDTLIHRPFQKRFFLAALIVAVLAYLFWTGSRYPALNEKAMMSGAIQLEDALSFEAKFPVTADMNIFEHIFWSTMNWINTNKKGMTFGVLFAAAFLTAAGYLKTKSFRGRFSNSLLGLVIGTPLGVCVNCAAPIARGMYSSGLRAETTLSAMIASPTLNMVVLTMLFSLVPVYMALTKVALSLLIILVLVPLICRTLPRTEIAPEHRIQTGWSAADLTAGEARPEGLHMAVWEVAKSYARNLWYIIRLTVPLMLLAGFLGTVAAVLLPTGLIMGLPFSLLMLVGIAAVGVFLPVPIGFDVVMAGVLLASGLEQGYVMALLFTLGSFSVYSHFIVAQSVGPRAAWMLAATVLVCGVLAGLGAQGWHQYQTDRALKMLTGEAVPETPPRLLWAAQAADAVPWQVVSDDATRITIEATPFAPPSPAAETGFTRVEAAEAGIDKPLEFSMADMWPPFWEGRSVASGDIDNDGDLDLAVASTEQGLYLYANDGAGQFTRMAANPGPLADMAVFNAVIADIDNDGWRDLILATYRQGNYLWRNSADGFVGAPEPILNRDDAVLSLALSLGDPDRDGDLDLALGNWTSGWYRRVPGEESRNRVVWNDAGALTGQNFTDLPGIPGETLSVLFSDFDNDGQTDLLVGNDFEIPDYLYRGDGAGGFSAITHADNLLPHTTTTTMAIKTADLMNDGVPEIYFAQIAGRSSGVSKKLKMQPLGRYCDGIADPQAKAACAQNMQIKTWYKSGNNFDPTYAGKCQDLTGRLQAECKAMLVKDLAIQRNDPSICKLIPNGQPRPRSFCELHFLPIRAVTAVEAEESVQQVLRSNVLLEHDAAGDAFTDTAGAHGLEVGGWSWDTKVADFDQDGWQDVYIVNGTWVPNEVSPSNLYFHNNGDGTFTEASGPMGLEDYLMTAAATAFDMDGDGDLDILSHPVNGPMALFRNNTQSGHAIAFQLTDMAGNRDGIGARVEITDDLGRTMTREVQLGGGFMSFDAPRVHFGLGAARRVTQLRIRWADGSETAIMGPLEADALYHLRRAG